MIRLLRIEVRHSVTPLVLPLLAVLLWITPLARDLTPVALWLDRSVDVEGSLQLIGPFAAGTAAWMASRGSRRTMGDLLTSTPRNPLTRALTTWFASAGWIAAFYVALCAVFLSIAANQATWGSPLWWPAVDGFIAAITCSAIGFALGQWFPSRLTTPLAAVGVLALILGIRSAAPTDRSVGLGVLSPIYPTFGLDASVFHRPLPDLSILKLLLYLGILVITLGALAWRARTERPVLRSAGTALLAAGVALSVTAGILDSTAYTDGHGIIVPAFHSTGTATEDQAVPYTPVCSHTPLPVCVHPAYAGGNELAVLATAINAVARPVLGVPGMPVRAEQTADKGFGVRGNPPVLPFPNFIVHGNAIQPPLFDEVFTADMALSLFSGPVTATRSITPVQRALALYLVQQAHRSTDPRTLTPQNPAVAAAATRFAALTPTARTTWLAAHLAAIRAGHLTPQDIP